MIVIDSLTKKLQIKLGAPATTNQLVWTLSYAGEPAWGATDGQTNDTTMVDMVLGPQGVPNTPVYGTRKVATISVYNADTAAATVSIIFYNGATTRVVISVSLQSEYSLHYQDAQGWYVLDGTGALVETEITITGIAINDNVIGSVAGKYLYVDGAFTLQQGYLSQSGNDVEIENGKFISSVGGTMQVDFGNGAYWKVTTDAGAGGESTIYLDSTHAQLASIDGVVYIAPAFMIVQHAVQIMIDSPIINIPQLTASTVLYLDASKNLVSSAVTPTQLSYLDATSSIQTQLNGKQPLGTAASRKIFGQQNTTGSVTGTLTETIIFNLSIPANSMGLNDVLWFEALLFSIGTTNTKTFKSYIGPNNNSLVGATQMGQAQLTATQLSGGFQRRVANRNSLSTNNVYPATVNNPNDQTNQTTAKTVININFAVQQYFMITGTLANIADLAGIDNVQVYINKP